MQILKKICRKNKNLNEITAIEKYKQTLKLRWVWNMIWSAKIKITWLNRQPQRQNKVSHKLVVLQITNSSLFDYTKVSFLVTFSVPFTLYKEFFYFFICFYIWWISLCSPFTAAKNTKALKVHILLFYVINLSVQLFS